MIPVYQHYKIFISSPGDVAEERKMSEEVVNAINKNIMETLGIALELKRWEDLPPQTPYLPEEQIQDILNRIVEESNFFVLILYKRYGTIESGHDISNTEREINTILKAFEKKPQIKILSYFRDIPPNDDPGTQEQKVKDLKKRLQDKGIFYKSYSTPFMFKEILTHDLYDVILKMKLSSFKHHRLKLFWQFGIPERPTFPSVAILYPSVQREYMGGPNNRLWLNRLKPNIYYEDFKAIQKLHKVFNLIGFKDYRIYPHTDYPSDIISMNRIWLCFPRLVAAQNQLKRYVGISRFNFLPRTRKRMGAIIWSNKYERNIRIESPLARYLEIQRSEMDISGEWHSQLNRIIAKDFAIVARFSDHINKDVASEGLLKDYFFAGIRGLGTWGSAWFIDRKYKHLPMVQDDENIQILLEVIYQNDRIFDVIDVSEEPPEYFKEQNNLRVIKKTIRYFKESRHIF